MNLNQYSLTHYCNLPIFKLFRKEWICGCGQKYVWGLGYVRAEGAGIVNGYRIDKTWIKPEDKGKELHAWMCCEVIGGGCLCGGYKENV